MISYTLFGCYKVGIIVDKNMAVDDKYCLRLNSFGRNVKTCWQDLEIDKDLWDVTLGCEDKHFKTHKVVPSSFNPVLKDKLKTNQSSNVLIYLRRVKSKDFQNLLKFMYQGELDVQELDLPSFLEIAEDLSIRGLSEGNTDNFTSSSYQGLSFHKKSVHFGIKYSCHLCNHKGTIQGNLNKHITRFHEVKLYPCNKCGYVAAQNEILKLHMKSIHEGERYPCNKCDYNAKRSSNLISHVKSIHEGERHQCGQCDYKATQKSNGNKHIMKVHN